MLRFQLSSTGAVTLATDPDHETQAQYSFAVIATDAAGNASEAQAVTLDINDLDEFSTTVTSGATAVAIDENSVQIKLFIQRLLMTRQMIRMACL